MVEEKSEKALSEGMVTREYSTQHRVHRVIAERVLSARVMWQRTEILLVAASEKCNVLAAFSYDLRGASPST